MNKSNSKSRVITLPPVDVSEFDSELLSLRIKLANIATDIYKKQREMQLWPTGWKPGANINFSPRWRELGPDLAHDPYVYLVDSKDNENTSEILAYVHVHRDELIRAKHTMQEIAQRYAEVTWEKKLAEFHERADYIERGSFDEADTVWVSETRSSLMDIFGPYESYMDTQGGIRRMFQSAVVTPSPSYEALVTLTRNLFHDFEEKLKTMYGNKSSGDRYVHVVDLVHVGGERIDRNVPSASILPNWNGPRKVFLYANAMNAYVEHWFNPGARQFGNSMTKHANLAFVLAHELSHGLPWRFEESIYGSYKSTLEELKADVSALFYAADQPHKQFQELFDVWATRTSLLFARDLSNPGAHRKAECIALRWLYECGAIDVSVARGIQLALSQEDFSNVIYEFLEYLIIMIQKGEADSDIEPAKHFVGQYARFDFEKIIEDYSTESGRIKPLVPLRVELAPINL